MRSRPSLAELIRQDVLDLDPEPPRRPCPVLPRLLILAHLDLLPRAAAG